MKKLFCILTGLLIFSGISAQKYITKNGMIKFYSEAPMEKIEAVNNQVISALDITNGNIVFKVLMKGFEFKKALMQEHFNENYIQSDKFPEAIFKGQIENLKDINFNKEGKYEAKVAGDITIHGVTKHINQKGTFEVLKDKISGKSVFNINIKDYDIKIPNTVVNNISETVQITVDISLAKSVN
jgi:polyisoprenoid-binding protein YceI